MQRRDFLKRMVYFSAAISYGSWLTYLKKPAIVCAEPPVFDIAKVNGSDIVTMVQRGIDAIGGIGNFVKSGQTVAIKPNFSWGRSPEEAYTTNPYVVGALVGMCKQAGAKEVNVIDHTCTTASICLHKTGIQREVEAAGGKAFNITNFRTVSISGGYKLKTVDFSTDSLDADVLISVPIAKQWAVTNISVGMKNWMGLIKDRKVFHEGRGANIHEMIVDLMRVRKPDLTIIDAIRVLTNKSEETNTLLIGTDPVALDAIACKEYLRIDPFDIPHITLAHSARIGSMNYQTKSIANISC